jgi:hypothetical protein
MAEPSIWKVTVGTGLGGRCTCYWCDGRAQHLEGERGDWPGRRLYLRWCDGKAWHSEGENRLGPRLYLRLVDGRTHHLEC